MSGGDSPSNGWYVHSKDGQEGPLSLAQLREKIFNRAVSPQDHAWRPGMADWRKIEEIDILKDSLPTSEESQSVTLVDPKMAGKQDSLDNLAATPLGNSPFGEKSIGSITGAQLQTHATSPSLAFTSVNASSAENEKVTPLRSSAPAEQVTVTPAGVVPTTPSSVDASAPLSPKKKLPTLPVLLALFCGAIAYFALSMVDSENLRPQNILAWIMGVERFPKFKDLNPQENKLLKDTALADLKTTGPKIEWVHVSPSADSATFYFSTNIPDGAQFDLGLKPIPETLVGEPPELPMFSIRISKHLAQVKVEKVAPGYYWAFLSPKDEQSAQAAPWVDHLPEALKSEELTLPSTQRPPVLLRKIFLGGVPDLGYQTRLSDYSAVRRGMARAELDRLRDATTKIEALLAAENQAAITLNGLKIEQAKSQAWDLFQNTWNQALGEIDNLLSKPMRFLGKNQKLAFDVKDQLMKLHERHHELVQPGSAQAPATGQAATSSQLSAGSVSSAKILAEGQMMSNEITSRIQTLKLELDASDKKLADNLSPIVEDPFVPATHN